MLFTLHRNVFFMNIEYFLLGFSDYIRITCFNVREQDAKGRCVVSLPVFLTLASEKGGKGEERMPPTFRTCDVAANRVFKKEHKGRSGVLSGSMMRTA